MECLHITNYTKQSFDYLMNECDVPCGNKTLEKLIGCYKTGELICIAGAGGNGKSTLLRSILFNLAINEGVAAGYFCSLGITKERLISQFLYAIGRISFESWTHSTLSDKDKETIEKAIPVLEQSSLYVNIKPLITIDQIEDDAERLVKNEKVKILFVENLQGIQFDQFKNRGRDAAQRLRMLAQRLNIPIVVSSDVNWWMWEREGLESRFPQLGDLTQVGDLNDIADIVLGVYRPELDHVYLDVTGQDLKGKLRVEVLKSYRSRLRHEFMTFGKNCLTFE